VEQLELIPAIQATPDPYGTEGTLDVEWSRMKSLFVIALSCAAVCAHADIDPASIVAAYLFDEDAKDASGNGNDGELEGGNFVDGKFGQAVALNGTSEWMAVPKMGEFQEISILAWVNLTGRLGDWRVIYNADGWKAGDIHHQLAPNNQVEFSIHSNPGGNDQFGAFLFDKDDIGWTHIATVYSAQEQKIRFYVNGELDVEADWGGNPAVVDVGRIGSWSGGGREWDGVFDEVIFFNTVLDQPDVETLAETGLNATRSVQPEGKMTTAWAVIKAWSMK
jgi:hypothetical protein